MVQHLHSYRVVSEVVLNQDEIQDLLAQTSSQSKGGGLWQGKTSAFDFFAAALQKDQKIQAANKLHSQAATQLGRVISKVCEAEISVELDKHEVIVSSDIIADINVDEKLTFVWQDERAGLDGLFLLNRSLYFHLYNILFGGTKSFEKSGPLTPLEQSLLDRLILPIIETLQGAWKGYGQWQFKVREFITQQEKLAGLGWTFDCFRATFKMSHEGNDVGEFVAVFPYIILNNIEQKDGSAAHVSEGGSKDKHWVHAVRYAIQEKKIHVSASLGTLKLPIQEVLKMEEGNEYVLRIPKDGHSFYIEGKQMFTASIGVVDEHRAIRLEKFKQGEEDE